MKHATKNECNLQVKIALAKLRNYTNLSPASIKAIESAVEDSEKVLVAVPKDIKVLSGYRSVDAFMSSGIPVGFWQEAWGEWRGDMSYRLGFEAEDNLGGGE